MAPSFNQHLDKLGRTLVWWRAQLKLKFGVAAVLAGVSLFGLMDLWLRSGRIGRMSSWLLLVGLAGVTLWLFRKAQRYRYSTQGVAATVEKAFPELDNHLINYVQFSATAGNNPFKLAYLDNDPPSWDQIDPRRMKNIKAHRQGWMALAAGILLLLAPGLFFGNAWPRALARIVNPFSSLPPISLTNIIEVKPGAATVLQGDSVVLSCKVQGMEGHEVRVEIDPDDARPTSTVLGRIASGEEEEFARRIPQVNTGLRYRFKAGDATPSPWQTIRTRPPPAFTDIQLRITPPAYTGRPAVTRSGWDKNLEIPQGSEIQIAAVCNTDLKALSISTAGKKIPASQQGDGPKQWKAELAVTGGQTLLLQAEDVFDAPLEEQLGFSLAADSPPAIEITAPRGRTVLPPGEGPRIEFRVSDDFGLDAISVEREQVARDGRRTWVSQQTWQAGRAANFQQSWQGSPVSQKSGTVTYRISAKDTCSFTTNITTSIAIKFDAQSHANAAKEREKLEAKAVAGLNQVIEWQKLNLKQTRQLSKTAEQAGKEQWREITQRQTQIRQRTRQLLENPLKPLGNMSGSIKKAYLNEMSEAVNMLGGIPNAAPDTRAAVAVNAANLEERILRQLTAAEMAMGKSKVDRRVSGLSTLLSKMVRSQSKTLKETQEAAAAKAQIPPVLVDAQDELASDLTEFTEACKRESSEVKANDANLSRVLIQLAERAEQDKIRNDMMLAAEKLDQNRATGAIPHEESSLKKLRALQTLLDDVKLQGEQTEKLAMSEAVGQAKEKMKRIKELHKRMLESMDAMKAQEDKSDEQIELMEEAYEALVKNTKEAMMEVPTDLHIFMDLNVANDVVEDVFAIFQEIEQTEGSEKWTASNVVEKAFMKEEQMLAMMEEAEDRIDDMEMWLEEEPDKEKVTTEAFDQEEMAEEGMALGALANQVEDLISDLVEEENEDLEEAADDGATNHGLPDLEIGHKVEEGDTATFSAKGKSGSQRPDHKEQDGRSNVGRQGMAVGETAAGSGTVGEGDDNIEKRRTNDPTQSGKVDLAGEADTQATGGGKLASGKADSLGMTGGVKRMDSTEEGSWEGMAALMAKQADRLYAKASMKNVRVESLHEAAHHLRQSADAIANGRIDQVKELKRLAVGALQQSKADLIAGPSAAFEADGSASMIDDVVEGGSDVAPPRYRDEVAEYYKALNEVL